MDVPTPLFPDFDPNVMGQVGIVCQNVARVFESAKKVGVTLLNLA